MTRALLAISLNISAILLRVVLSTICIVRINIIYNTYCSHITSPDVILISYLILRCRVRDYGDLTSWPKASVILAFHDNEHLSDVLHTVHSIIQRSPDVLLKEIIIIDDNSIKGEAEKCICLIYRT